MAFVFDEKETGFIGKKIRLITLSDSDSGYQLSINTDSKANPKKQIWFKVGSGLFHGVVTASDLADYPPSIKKVGFRRGMKVIDVGSGLGELPHYAFRFTDEPVVIIDPANYYVMQQLVTVAMNQINTWFIQERLGILDARCDEILYSPNIVLHNDRLENVYTVLECTADIVIDAYGPNFYFDKSRIEQMERVMLREHGLLVT